MLDISNKNIITMTRGDNETIPLKLFTDNYKKKYIFFPNRNDKIFFALMEPNQTFETAILKKIFGYDDVDQENGVINIKLDSIDTEFLASGDYYYTIKILRKDSWEEESDDQGTVETLVERTKFIIVDSIRESQLPDLSVSDVHPGVGYLINEDGTIRIISNGFRTILSVNISGKEGNLLRKEDDGLYAYLDTSDFATKSGDVKHLQEEIDETNQEVDSVKEDVSGLHDSLDKVESDVEDLHSNVTKLSGDLDDVKEDVSSIHHDIGDIQEEIIDLSDEVEEVKETYATKLEISEVKETLEDEIDTKQDQLVAGDGIIIDGNVISTDLSYNDLGDKPQINGFTLEGNKTSSDLGIVTEEYVDEGLAKKKDNFEIFAGEGIEVDEDSAGNITIINTTAVDNSNIHSDTTANWNAQVDLVAKKNHIYVYTDYQSMSGVNIPGIKTGDGTTYLIDLPFVDGNQTVLNEHIANMNIHVSNNDRAFWNNKVTCFISKGDAETIVFTKGEEN